ncbi:MAG: ACP phosphodiesterase [Firmicutes bacterium]|nr:ACP phosphodiesterase [Bacillota bacterium]
MDSILFINACVRSDSRTERLARKVLEKLSGNVQELNLELENIKPLSREALEYREARLADKDFSDPVFKYAKQFAEADVIVMAAPYWDLSFPALIKIYVEAINILGIAFNYTEEGIPHGLCRASKLIYITTAGGPIYETDYGFDYIKALAENFYGIKEVVSFKAMNLDIEGADVEAILSETIKEIENSNI